MTDFARTSGALSLFGGFARKGVSTLFDVAHSALDAARERKDIALKDRAASAERRVSGEAAWAAAEDRAVAAYVPSLTLADVDGLRGSRVGSLHFPIKDEIERIGAYAMSEVDRFGTTSKDERIKRGRNLISRLHHEVFLPLNLPRNFCFLHGFLNYELTSKSGYVGSFPVGIASGYTYIDRVYAGDEPSLYR